MKARTALFSFLMYFLFPINFFSQAPGYMGKKFVVGYGVSISPVSLGPSVNNFLFNYREIPGNSFSYGMLHEGYLERVISTRILIGASAKYYKTIYENLAEVHSAGRPTSNYTLVGVTSTFYGKYFGEPFLAPWGKYYMAGVAVNNVRSEYDPYMYTTGQFNQHDTLYNNFGPIRKWHTGFDILVGKGRNRIIGNSLTVDYGYNAQLISMVFKIGKMLTFINEVNTFSASAYIPKTAKRRMRDFNFLNLYLKIGFLF